MFKGIEVYKIFLTKSDLNVPGIEPSLIVQLFGNQAKTGLLNYKLFIFISQIQVSII